MASFLMKKSKRYINEYLYSQSENTRGRVKKEVEKLKMLKSYVVVPYYVLSSTTFHRGTLDVVEARQYRSHGLIHVSDAYFEAGNVYDSFNAAKFVSIRSSWLIFVQCRKTSLLLNYDPNSKRKYFIGYIQSVVFQLTHTM